MKTQNCFYTPGHHSIIDTATADNRGTCTGETLEQIRKRHPGAELTPLAEAILAVREAQRDHFRRPPEPITEKQFTYFLEVLPPVGWTHTPDAESFKVSEQTAGNLTQICCRIGKAFFGLCDEITLTHAEIVKACRATSKT